MRNYIGYIIDYSDGNLSVQKRNWFEGELVRNKELKDEYNLFKRINDSMRGKFDLEEVQNDPYLKTIETHTSQMISEFNQNPNKFSHAKNFVDESLKVIDLELQKNLNKVIQEAEKENINEVTREWVEEWNAKSQTTPEMESRRAFISSSLNGKDHNNKTRKANQSKKFAIRITAFAAAAMIAGIVLIKTLSPTANPEKLYLEYYKPLNAYTSTTRNNTNLANPFSDAVEFYKQGKYQSAAALFSELIVKDPNSIANRFFAGITQLELGEYNQSIGLLNDVISRNGEYKKEAQWYLGLAYLKTGETQKAISCLKELTVSKGYYQVQAQDLLNHLE